MGRLSEGLARLAERQTELNGEAITYTRGVTALSLTAVPGVTQQPVDTTNSQTSVRQTHKDFLIDPATIIFSSVVSDPLEGDRIAWDSKTWEVAAISAGEKCWTPCDGYGHLIRVHTRQEA